jgi:ribosome-binding factor A
MKRFSKDTLKTERSPRQLRVGEELRHAIAAAIQEGNYPWPATGDKRPATITVTEVKVSPDLRNATCFIMPLGGHHIENTVKALNMHAHFFKSVIAKEVILKYVPALKFAADTSFDYAARIEKILHDPAVARDLKNNEEADE